MKKLIAAAGLGAAVTVATVVGAAPANAYGSGYYYTTTNVEWGGSSCIGVNEAYGGYETFCGYGGGWRIDERVDSGQDFGLDPVMGSANWISCEVYINTQLVYSDFATNGDGHDVNCLRNKN